MLVSKFCHNFFNAPLSTLNQARIKCLWACVDGLVKGNRLTLTSIGRHLPGKAFIKHKIKRVDRFLSSRKLHKDINEIYAQVAHQVLKTLPFYVIAIDWSGCCNKDFWVLRASLVFDGRAIPLLNKVVSSKEQEKAYIHEQFLDDLYQCLPSGKEVYILTDGGFKTPWFSKVATLGWFFVGRLRGRIYTRLEDGEWGTLSLLMKHATRKPKYLGTGEIGKTSKTRCQAHFHLYKEEPKGRHKKRGRKQPLYPDREATYKGIAKEPWLLVTNHPSLTPKEIVHFYRKRMQIEQNFRDDKSQRYGFGWDNSFTVGEARIAVLCLISTIAVMVLWLIGFDAEQRKLHRKYQANTIKHRRVLSFITLAKGVLNEGRQKYSEQTIFNSINTLASSYRHQLKPELQ